MILKSITLRDFRKFKNIVIEFPDGITGVIGLNGVGKSTIFEAMAWVLYGPIAARTKTDEIKRDSAEHSDPCRVELDFVFDDNNYHIVREMSGKSLSISASILLNEKLVATGAEPVNKYILKKFGMDFKSFSTSIFARQKELNTLSSMNTSERRPLILKMLGINSLDEVLKEVKADKREKKSVVDRLDSDLFDDLGASKIKNHQIQIKTFEKNKEKLKIIINRLKGEIETLEKKIKHDQKKYLVLKKNYEAINQRKDELEKIKESFEKKKSFSEEIKKLSKLIRDREGKVEYENNRLSTFKNIDEEVKKVDEKIKSKIIQNQEFLKEISKKKALIERINEDISEIDYNKMKIEKMGPDANCPTCNRVLGSQYNNLIKGFEKEKKAKIKGLIVFKNDIEKAKKKQEVLSKEFDALKKKSKYLNSKFTEKEKILIIISNFKKEIEREKKEIDINQKNIKVLGKIDFSLEDFNEVKKIVKKSYNQYQINLDNLNVKRDKLSEKKLELERFISENKLINQRIENLNDKVSKLKELEVKIKEEKTFIQNLEILTDVLILFRSDLISRVRPALSAYASDFFERLTDGKYNEIELDENYNLKVYDNKNLYDIERFSGGEMDLANLCLRLAISEVITERSGGIFNFIVLDEIFGSQDSIRRQNILDALNSLSSKFRQIFLITHIDDLKNYMENIISVSENDDGISSIKLE